MFLKATRIPLGFILLTAAIIATSHLLLGKSPLCAVQQALRTTHKKSSSMSTRTGSDQFSCADTRFSAIDSNNKPCIPLHNLTQRTFIHRASTPQATYMYCSIPKNGCSYHIDLLHRVNGDAYPGAAKHMTKNKVKIILSDEAEAARLLNDKSVPKYMVIRNPLTRALSGYLCKVEKFLPKEQRTPETFQEWARQEFTGLKSWDGVNSHWKAQTEFCGYGLRDVQKRFRMFRVEEPVDYVDYIYSFAPAEVLVDGWGETAANNTSFREFVLGPRKRTGHTEEKFFRYVASVEMFDFLARVFRKDIDVFGYRVEVNDMRQELRRLVKSRAIRRS